VVNTHPIVQEEKMKTGKAGRQIIQKWEGYHTALPNGDCEAYLDRVAVPPVWTIGFGCTEGVHKGMVMSRKEAEAFLDKEIAQTEAEVAKVLRVELNQNQYDALISIAYNLKGGIRKAPTLMKHINNQDWAAASKAFMLYTGAGKKKIQGLVNRRADEVRLFNTIPKAEIKEKSKTVRLFDRLWKFLTSVATAFISADALDVGRTYIDWIKEFSSNNKYLLIAGAVGMAYAIFKYLQHKKAQESAEGRYTPAPVDPPGVA
jgi:GH24 family phage-related lysozyme (muramidase)